MGIAVLVLAAISICTVVCQAEPAIPFWRSTIADGITRDAGELKGRGDLGLSSWNDNLAIPSLRQNIEQTGSLSKKSALKRAMMSAILPGTGQLRNGSLLRGLGYMAIELTGWISYTQMKNGVANKTGDLGDYADQYWFIEQYREGAYNSYYEYDQQPDSLVAGAQEHNRSRFYDYIARESYACGWDTTRVVDGATEGLSEEEQIQFYRDLRSMHRQGYLSLWNDREDLRNAKTLSGRMIFLNHLVSAVDAFIEARRMVIGDSGELGIQMGSVSARLSPSIVYTHRFN